jgi:Carboxypeptidase regulatory-like domain/Bacterial Ig-like domain (group 2)
MMGINPSGETGSSRFLIGKKSGFLLLGLSLLYGCSEGASSPVPAPSSSPAPSPTLTVKSVAVTGTAPTIGDNPQQFRATATMSDGSSKLVTSVATWESSNTQVASVIIGFPGAVTATGPGEAEIRAAYESVVGSIRISIAPSASIPLGLVTIHGQVEDYPTQKPLSSVDVQVLDGVNKGRSTVTDAGGNFRLEQLQNGSFNVQFAKPSYTTVVRFLEKLPPDKFMGIDMLLAPLASPVTTTFLSVTSEPGDYVGGGQSHRYTLADGTWQANYIPGVRPIFSHIYVSIGNFAPDVNWDLMFDGPSGAPLTVGTYENATKSRLPGQPGINIGGNHHGCNSTNGRFTILEVVYGDNYNLDRLHVTFEQHCEGVSPALRGELAIVSNPWR